MPARASDAEFAARIGVVLDEADESAGSGWENRD